MAFVSMAHAPTNQEAVDQLSKCWRDMFFSPMSLSDERPNRRLPLVTEDVEPGAIFRIGLTSLPLTPKIARIRALTDPVASQRLLVVFGELRITVVPRLIHVFVVGSRWFATLGKEPNNSTHAPAIILSHRCRITSSSGCNLDPVVARVLHRQHLGKNWSPRIGLFQGLFEKRVKACVFHQQGSVSGHHICACDPGCNRGRMKRWNHC
jgi:hypothetical protein